LCSGNDLPDSKLKMLNERVHPEFSPAENDFFVYLTTTNDLADMINHSRLSALKGKVYDFAGTIDGTFEERNLPTHEIYNSSLVRRSCF